jgi:hypothetical protein
MSHRVQAYAPQRARRVIAEPVGRKRMAELMKRDTHDKSRYYSAEERYEKKKALLKELGVG